MIVTLFDYGAGNLHSLAKALERAGGNVRIETDPVRALTTQALVLPGVGAFGAAAERLAPGRVAMREALARGLPCLGVCLGMQLLFDASDEGDGAGLGFVPGRVRRLTTQRIPHMGWNDVAPVGDALAFPPLAYFAHSFACDATEACDVAAWTTHETDRFASAVVRGRTLGVQFHPEKSGPDGLRLLSSWLAWAAREVPSCS